MSPPQTKNKPPALLKMLLDSSVPIDFRVHLLRQAILEEGGEQVLLALAEKAGQANGKDTYEEKIAELRGILEQMEAGPLRVGTYVGSVCSNGFGPRMEVAFSDGSRALCLTPEENRVKNVLPGDHVWIESGAKAVLHSEPLGHMIGEEARLERFIDSDHVLVTVREQGRFVYTISARLQKQIKKGEADVGDTVIVCPQRMMAFSAIPREDGLSHLTFLDRRPVPDVVIERDIGDPPAFLDAITAFLDREMRAPGYGKKYGLNRSWLQLLWGVSGAGKSLSIQGLCRWIAELSSELTGIPVDELPPRTMRMRSAQLLSKWFGESDRLIDRFFREVEELSGQTVIGKDGREYELPTVVICEEIDGLMRARGEDSIHDRIQSGLLEHLDGTVNERFKNRLIIVICTTNVPALVDPAMLRRTGAKVERFGRLGRRGCADVIAKHLGGRPVVADGTTSAATARKRTVQDLVAWIYGPHAEDPGQVEVTFVGSSTPEMRYRRDFITGGLIDRAVQNACAVACRDEYEGRGPEGLDTGLLMQAIDDQVRAIVDQLDRTNATSYLTLPEGARVGGVRRLPRTSVLPGALERVS